MAEPILNPQAEQAAPLGRDFSRESATLKRIGANPLALGTLDQKTLFEATYKPEELKSLPDYQKLTQQQGNLSNAEANLGTAERAAAPSTLRILEEALRTKNDVGVQPLGQSDLFKQAGLTGYSTLNQSLAQRGREMQDRYGSFVNQLSKVSGVLKDNYEVALSEYGRLNEKYKAESERFNKVLDEIAAQERQFELMDKEEEIIKQRKKEEFTWNTDLGKWTNAYGETREPTPEQSAASQAWQNGLVRSAQSSDITGQTVIDEYNPYGDNCALYVQNKLKWVTPGMGNVEQRKANVAKNGFTDPSKVKVGDVVLTSEGKAVDSNGIRIGHTAIITNINNGIITLEEANYKAGKVTTGRKMSINDGSIIGFLSPESVQRKGALPQEAVNMFAVRQGRGWDPATEGVNPAIEDQYIASGALGSLGTMDTEFRADRLIRRKNTTEGEREDAKNRIIELISANPNISDQQIVKQVYGTELTPEQADAANALRDDLRNNQQYKDMLDIRNGFIGVNSGLRQNDGFGDIAAINSFQRMIDPGATVREGDITVLQKASALFDRADFEFIKQSWVNGDVLPPAVRERMKTVANDVYNSQANIYNSGIGKQFKASADRLNVPYEMVVEDFPNPDELLKISGTGANTSENINLSDLDFKF